MEISNVYDDKGGTFTAKKDGQEVGKLTFKWTPDLQLDIDHTESSEPGAGTELVRAAVKFGRENDLVFVSPSCEFARAVFEKNPELQDVLKK